MDSIFKKNIAEKILSRIPVHIDPVSFLEDILKISKESVYRRIKGEVPFTLEDLIKLSSELSFSLDEIINSNANQSQASSQVLFRFRTNRLHDPQKNISDILSAYLLAVKKAHEVKSTEVLFAANHLTLQTIINQEHLFKFYYYKWAHQTNHMPFSYGLSDVIIPDAVAALLQEVRKYSYRGKFIGIIDRNFFKNTLLQIQYYYKRNLISKSELILIQDDLYKLLEQIESMIRIPATSYNFTNNIYLSSFRIESSAMYLRYDEEEEIHFWVYSGADIISNNHRICRLYKTWFNSVKKYATLITGCNEALQTEFIDQQKEYIRNIANEKYSYE